MRIILAFGSIGQRLRFLRIFAGVREGPSYDSGFVETAIFIAVGSYFLRSFTDKANNIIYRQPE